MAALRSLMEAALRDRRRAAAAAAAVLLIVAVAVTAAVWAGHRGPSTEAGSEDLYQAAPECGDIPADALGDALGEPVLDSAHRGLLEDSEGAVCSWTSIGAEDADPRFLRVDFQARFTDGSGDTTGAESARAALADLRPFQSGASAVPDLGPDARAWRASPSASSAEVAFRLDNLTVRVAYGGATAPDGTPIEFADARDSALAVAESIATAL